MKQVLDVLRLRRDARRDAALAQLVRARRQADDTRSATAAALAAVTQAGQWREALLRGQSPAAGAAEWGPDLLHSCEALVRQKLQAVGQARDHEAAAEQAVQAARHSLALRERACLRTDELQAQARTEARRCSEALEQSLEEDLAASRRGQAVTPRAEGGL
jgi:hypothetical protein